MDIAEIGKLAAVQGDPAVSILCRLDHRRPGNLEDPRRLTALHKQAVEAIAGTNSSANPEELLERLSTAVASVDFTHPPHAVAILATADESHVVPLPFPVESRVVVGAGFATRALLDAAQRTVHARVLVLAAERARCFEATGPTLRELHTEGFPMHITPPVQEDTPHADLPIGEHEHAEAHRFVFRAVDHAFAARQRRQREPLIVVAVERDLAYFDEVTRHGDDIIARVRGNHIEDSVEKLEQIVAPSLDIQRQRRSTEAAGRAHELVDSRAVAGFADAIAAARAGRGHELVVEEGLRVPSAETDSAFRDPVDELIAAVLTHDGTVSIVPDGALTDVGGVVLIVRY